jgi:ATP synthase protein I
MSARESNGRRAGARAPLSASGPTVSPWLSILAKAASAAGAGTLVVMGLGFMIAGGNAALGALLGAALVVVFFAISLLVGHYVGRSNPSGAIGAFIATYVLKVVGFGAVLFLIGTPAWLDTTWFFVAAVVAVVVWQAAEVFAFSRVRYQIYGDSQENASDIVRKDGRHAS